MAVTYQEYIIQKLYSDGMSGSDTGIIKDLIDEDIGSEERQVKLNGIVYYRSRNDKIMDREMFYYLNGLKHPELNRANNKVPSGFLKILVDQKVDYLLGKPPTITSETEGDVDKFNEIAPGFHELLQETARQSSKKSVEGWYSYVDEDGNFQFMNMAGEDLIFIYDTSHLQKLLGVIRYYAMEVVSNSGEKIFRKRVEWYDEEKVTYYMEQDDKSYLMDMSIQPNPQYHWTSYNDITPEDEESHSFGLVPIVPLWNNSSHMSDLEPIKPQVDVYDIAVSDFANNIEDIQDALVVLKGYEGEITDELIVNIKTKKVIIVGEGGDVGYKTVDIPSEAREKILDRLKTDIYTFGQGFDPSQVGDGNITGVVLEGRYSLLKLKANRLETQLTKLFNNFIDFINIYLVEIKGEKPIDCKIKFNRTVILDMAGAAEAAAKSKGVISDETIWENSPLVEDVEQEKARMKGEDPFGEGE